MTNTRIFLLLTAASLVIRLGLFGAVGPELTTLYDEGEYLERGRAFGHIIESLARFEEPPEIATKRAYGRGTWPPAHPILLGIGMSILGDTSAVARLVVVVISAITTGLVFLLTFQFAGRRAALVAAGLHLLHPSFLGFSHYLWSETTFVLCLFLTAYFLVRPSDTRPIRHEILWAGLAGSALGMAALTRAAALPLFLVIPIWILGSGRGTRIAWVRVTAVLMMAALVILPWQLALQKHEGQFVPLSSAAQYNIALGGNLQEGDGRQQMKRQIRKRAKEREISASDAARSIAIEGIKAEPGRFAQRSLNRFRELWGPDTFVLRHVLLAIYPPLPGAVVWGVFLSLLIGLLALTGLAAAGISADPRSSGQALLLLMLVALALPPTLTISNSRLGLPLMALLLPMAGAGSVALASLSSRRRVAIGAFVVLVLVSALTVRSPDPLIHSGVSSHYRKTIAQLDGLMGTNTYLADCFRLRAEGPVELTVSEGYRFGRGGRTLAFSAHSKAKRVHVVGTTPGSSEPPAELRLFVRVRGASDPVEVAPVRREYWGGWATPVEGVSIWWCGGAINASNEVLYRQRPSRTR